MFLFFVIFKKSIPLSFKNDLVFFVTYVVVTSSIFECVIVQNVYFLSIFGLNLSLNFLIFLKKQH